MSVLKNKRKTAFSEFERQMLLLCRYTKDRLNTVPARYKKFVNPKIYDPTNKASTAVILANEQSPERRRDKIGGSQCSKRQSSSS